MVPADSDFSPDQFQKSVNNPNEGIYGMVITLRVEVMLEKKSNTVG